MRTYRQGVSEGEPMAEATAPSSFEGPAMPTWEPFEVVTNPDGSVTRTWRHPDGQTEQWQDDVRLYGPIPIIGGPEASAFVGSSLGLANPLPCPSPSLRGRAQAEGGLASAGDSLGGFGTLRSFSFGSEEEIGGVVASVGDSSALELLDPHPALPLQAGKSSEEDVSSFADGSAHVDGGPRGTPTGQGGD